MRAIFGHLIVFSLIFFVLMKQLIKKEKADSKQFTAINNKMRTEITEIETKKIIQTINKSKNSFLKKIN